MTVFVASISLYAGLVPEEPIRARRHDWNLVPMSDPVALPLIERVWSADDWDQICLGFAPEDMDERWFAFVEDDTLFVHRSWTGHAIYDARFERRDDGWHIAEARVTDDESVYRREDLGAECDLLVGLIDDLLLRRM